MDIWISNRERMSNVRNDGLKTCCC